MTLYFDTKVQFLDAQAVSTISQWHSNEPIFAVASYSQDQGGSVTIFDDTGDPIQDVTFPIHPMSQATSLAWHPEKRLLISGWENGEIQAWFAGKREFSLINGPHKAPIICLEFSEQGGRMVTADSMGVLTGWRCDNQGQFLTMFTHDLRDSILHVTFRRTVESTTNTELSNLAKAAVAGDENALDALTNWRPRTAARNLSHSGLTDNHCFYVGTEAGVMYYLNQSGSCTEVLRSDTVPFIQVLWHPKREAMVTIMEDMTVCHFMVESTGALTELDKVKLSGRVPGHMGKISWAGNSLAIITGDFSVRIWDIDTSDHFLLPLELPSTAMASVVGGSGSGGDNGNGGDSNTLPSKSNTITTSTSFTGNKTTMEVFTCISYCMDNQTLCGGTNQGNLYTWKRTNYYPVDVAENSWQLNNISVVRGAIKYCTWGICEPAKSCIIVNCIANVYILKEQPLIMAHSRDIWAIQKNANQFFVENCLNRSVYLHAEFAVTDAFITDKYIAVTNGRQIAIYKIMIIRDHELDTRSTTITTTITTAPINLNGSGGGGSNEPIFRLTAMNSFPAESVQLFIYNENILTLGTHSVQIYSMGGVVLRQLTFNDTEGRPIGANLNSNFLTIFTMRGFIKIFDISRHEPKLIHQPKCAYDLFANFGEIIMAKCNSDGTYEALTIATENLIPDGKIYLWNMETDMVKSFDFLHSGNLGDLNGFIPRLPINFFWDTDDARLFICEARCIQQQKLTTTTTNNNQNSKTISLSGGGASGGGSGGSGNGTVATAKGFFESQITIMFITEKCEIKELETENLISGEQLINLCVPNVITLKMGSIARSPLCDFKGMENSDATTRKIVIDFSLLVAEGNMDQAFRCIRSIQSESVWHNLARMCVQTGRLDVARVCLGHMRQARSIRALRKAMCDPDLEQDARVAVLAIELGMIDEAELLYKKCGRYDLLNRLLQSCGRFEEALKIAEQLDRVHLKNTYFKYAEHLKLEGDIQGALTYYDKCNNATHNITQMLLEDPNILKQYMQNATDPNLLKWWAQYVESTGDMDTAFKIYQKADDWFSQVRILCFLGEISRADSVARLSGDKSACYHLARHYENIGKISESIQFYTRAQTYGNAVRICKENDLQDELWNVANLARSRDKTVAAQYFEEIGNHKRSVELYHRAGMLHKAVEMAFTSQQPETLQVIASELDYTSDPELVTRCAEFFLEINQHQKAVHLLANAKQYERAMEICSERGVPITETLAEMLTPPAPTLASATTSVHTKNKSHNNNMPNTITEEIRIKLLIQLGDILHEQGDYHTATKKFTQAGDKMRAMKSLLKSGDTEKIIFFAGMSRQRDVYILAANYLQSLNWQTDGKILKNIVGFYSKGQAYDLLANFYATCAQVEIDEFRDYEKALKALQEAGRCLTKLPGSTVQRAADNLQITLLEVRKVVEVQQALERGENMNVIAVCRSILAHDERSPIRHTDVQAFLVEALVGANQYPDALNALRDLARQVPDWSSRNLVERALVEKIATKSGIDFDTMWNSGKRKINANVVNGDLDLDDDGVDEEIQGNIGGD